MRPRSASGPTLRVESLETRDVPAALIADSFEASANYIAPAGWQQWSSNGSQYYGVMPGNALSGAKNLAVYGSNDVTSRLWQPTAVSNDVSVSLAVKSSTPAPILLFARGQSLNTAAASYLGVSVSSGGAVVLRTATQNLKSVAPAVPVPNQWLRVTADFAGSLASVRVQRLDTQQFLNSSGHWQAADTKAITHTIASAAGTGLVGLGRQPGNYGSAVVDDFSVAAVATVAATPVPATPALPIAPTTNPRKYEHIRIAQLAYSGQPVTAFEKSQIANSVDLVVANPSLLNTLEAASAATPKTIYSNVSNLYENLLVDWIDTADARNVSREAAFYHVSQATPFTGSSPSSTPVTWFWNASKTSATGVITSVKANARGMQSTGVAFGGFGESVALGSLEEFREINVTISKAAGGGYTGIWEYVTAVDAAGRPTAWRPLNVISNTTDALKSSGQIVFEPQADWVTSRIGTAEDLYYVRRRTITGDSASAPVASKILGRDYVNARGTTTGIIPAFDANADLNADGYLNDSEYAARRSGADARFAYESRLFYPYYGQMRFVVNPTSAAVKQWAGEFHAEYLQANANADGLFLDNANGKLPFAGTPVNEATANYSADSAALVAAVKTAIGNRTIIVNTSGAGANSFADGVTAAAGIAFEEFLLRPTAANWSTVNDVAAVVNDRLTASPTAQVILDSHPGTTAMTDPRTRMGVLSYYYLLADPDRTYLMMFGGYSPASSWSQRSVPAAAVNVGKPKAAMSVFASGLDPANANLQYKVYGRTYDNALVLYKPLSYTLGNGTGTTAVATATTHVLGGSFRALNADGTQGPVVTSIALRNGEGAVLMRV